MIEGLKISITSQEIVKHCENQFSFHTEKADWYKDQAANFKANAIELPDGGSYTNQQNADSLSRSERDHRSKASWFAFVASHVIPNETYYLNNGELTTLELTK